MPEFKVACPQCQAPLRSSKPIPAGLKVKCPRCGLQFNTPHTNGAGGAHPVPPVAAGAILAGVPLAGLAVPPGTAARPGAIAAGVPGVAPAIPVGGPGGVHPGQPLTAGPANRGKALAIILGGSAALLLVVVVVVVLVCFSGGGPTEPIASEPAAPNPGWNLPPQPPGKKGPPPALIVLPKEEQERVDAVVKKGVDFLRERQNPANGTWGGGPTLGVTCLAALTLVETGAAPADPAVQKAAKYVRATAENHNTGGHDVYEISLAILFLDKLNDKADSQLIRNLTLRLVAAQTPQGGWSYQAPPLRKEVSDQLYHLLKDLYKLTPEEILRDQERMRAMPPQLRNLAVLRPEANQPQGDGFWRNGGDNSNTQFAILALLAARRHDIPLNKTLSLIVKRFRGSQNFDGSWNYSGNANVLQVPTMTCAGLLGLAVGFDVDDKVHRGKPTDDEQVKKALKHVSNFIGDPNDPNLQMQILYYMWSVERVGVLYQLKDIEGKQWYQWGVKVLGKHQHPNGSWQSGGPGATDIVDTCFALLFLQRANLAQDLTDKLMQLNNLPAAGGRPPGLKN